MKNETKKFDTVVIGGGPAGIMSALSASQLGAKVLLLEKNLTLGKKLLLTGGGRCNLTQAEFDVKKIVEKFGKGGKFLFSSFFSFGPKEVIDFFEKKNLQTKIENNNRVFPESNKAEDVLQTLQKCLKENKVEIIFGAKILKFESNGKKIQSVQLENGEFIFAKNFILATGGKSYPGTGATGDGYAFAKNLGHTIIPPSPALAPIKIKESWVKNLQGLSLKNVGLNLIQNNKKTKLESGEIIFTHFGLSGPAIINASKIIGEKLKKGTVFLELDLLPNLNATQLEDKLKMDFETYQKNHLKNYLSKIFPQKLTHAILQLAQIETDRKILSIQKMERKKLVLTIKNFRVSVDSILDFNHAMITSGGINLKKVDPKTMRSKIISNLFFAGEILDLDGPTGGYNLQIAWSTGYTAGKNATK